MPRSRSTRSSPMRSSTPSRGMHTAAAPPPAAHAPPAAAQPQQPGMFAQMASTAAGVAVGSAVGHTLANGVSSIFGGGSSEAAQPQQQQQYAQAPPQQFQQFSNETTDMCKGNADAFVNCLNSTNNDMSQCQYLLETLNACRAAARNY
ncbi:hypothetical protein EV183_003743 [Coemansia sp. RSA 2336]|nr:hypothetical protein EV183_003743 [Coemansia sp. RSA 2336]